MNEIIAVSGIWLISLVSAFISVRQPKGIDWYAQISSKQKMIMTLINTSIGLIVMVFFLPILQNKIWKVIVASAACIVVIFFLASPSNKFCEKLIGIMGFTPPEQRGGNGTGGGENEQNTLLDILSKILTVFNSVFLGTNIVCVIRDELNESTLIAHGVILFWTTLSSILLSLRGWKYQDEIDDISNEKKRKEQRRKGQSADFFAKRITDRNRK